MFMINMLIIYYILMIKQAILTKQQRYKMLLS